VAVIVVVPALTEAACPFDPAVLLMVATAVDDELQLTELVRFCVVPSLKVPVATNCAVVLGAIVGVIYVVATRKDSSTYELPFGSFLGLAALIVGLFGQVIVVWYSHLGA
jgi:prepilin signal peptidase PulO-like enzyme (type II secretory pathway)